MREISVRPPTSKNKWFSPRSYRISPSPSVSSFPSSHSVFRGRMALTSSPSFDGLPPFRSTVTSARRCPSVATRLIWLPPRMNKAPFKKKRVSSPVIANCVFATISFTAVSRQHCAGDAARFRHRREILAGQRLHPRVKTVGGNLDAVLVFGDTDIGFRQRLHDLVKFFCRQCQRSGFVYGRVTATAQRNFEVRRQHPNLIAFCFHQHVRQNRNRIFPFDDALEKLQFSQ